MCLTGWKIRSNSLKLVRPGMSLSRCMDRIWYQPSPYRWLLFPLGLCYRWATDLRRLMYRWSIRRVTVLPVPVVIVGNLTVGGTGKTPLVIWLAEELRQRGFSVGIVSRGYGGRARKWPQYVDGTSDPSLVGDEPVLLARATNCPVSVGPDRVKAARALLAREQVDVLLADDGLQHHALGRIMEIVVVDGERGLGNEMCVPAGPLRERSDRLASAGAVVVNGGVWGKDLDAGNIFRSAIRVQDVSQLTGSARKPLESFRGVSVHAVAAIGHPERFFRTLEAAGMQVAAHPLPDHASIRAADLRFDDSNPVMVTEKDAVKCGRIAHDDVWCVPIELSFEPEASTGLLALVLGHMEERRWISP